MTALRQSPVVGEPGQFRPLILDRKGRLYLQRFHAFETAVARAITERAGQLAEAVDGSLLRRGLKKFFPKHSDQSPDGQALATEIAVRRKLAIVTGGPGTGKTRTVAVMLALLLEQPGRCRIALAAPTGKAAARLQESIQRLQPQLGCAEELKARLPKEAFTLHRLLAFTQETGRTRYHSANTLPFEVIVVDEASMVDLVLMSKLLDALPAQARLILLGDKDQLASVDAGAVLGDLCQEGPDDRPLTDCLARLDRNYRFGPQEDFLIFSKAVNAGDADAALKVFAAAAGPKPAGGSPSGLRAVALPASARLPEALKNWVIDSFRPAVSTTDPRTALQALNQVRLLAAIRHGPFGTQGLNQTVETILGEAGLIQPEGLWYAGRPILITRNDYQLGLFNGDIGIILPEAGQPRAWFMSGEGELRCFPPARLPAHETVFAMTVHKSQGSEFESVLFVLPDRPVPVLTRELIYTGATRARKKLELWFAEPVFRAAVERRAERPSGLREALWGEAREPRPAGRAPAAKPMQLELGLAG
jgi:exodeoxyribonuclease V alpha subunit